VLGNEDFAERWGRRDDALQGQQTRSPGCAVEGQSCLERHGSMHVEVDPRSGRPLVTRARSGSAGIGRVHERRVDRSAARRLAPRQAAAGLGRHRPLPAPRVGSQVKAPVGAPPRVQARFRVAPSRSRKPAVFQLLIAERIHGPLGTNRADSCQIVPHRLRISLPFSRLPRGSSPPPRTLGSDWNLAGSGQRLRQSRATELSCDPAATETSQSGACSLLRDLGALLRPGLHTFEPPAP
jgi:hypothetical protein